MKQSATISSLAAALAKAQAEMPAVQFDAVNPFLKNRYASLGAVINTSRPVLARHGLTVAQLSASEGDQIGIETVLAHSSGEWLSERILLPIGDEKGKSRAQVAGSIITYLRRYSWASILGLYADEDTDGNEPERKPRSAPAAAPAPPPSSTKRVVGVQVTDVAEKTGTSNGKPWTAWFVKFDNNTEAGTFSEVISTLAKAGVGNKGKFIATVKDGKKRGTLELLDLEPVNDPDDVTP